MLKVVEIKDVVLTDSKGNNIEEEAKVVYRDKTDKDYVAIFKGFDKGLIKFKNTTNDTEYNVRVSSIAYIEVRPQQLEVSEYEG